MPSPSEAAKPCRATSVVLLAALSCGCGLLDKLRDADDEGREPSSPSSTPPDAEEPEADNAAATGDLPADGDTATAKREMVDHQVGKRDGPLKPGPVYFSVQGGAGGSGGIMRIQDGMFERILDCSALTGTDLVLGQDQHAYVLSSSGIFLLDGPDAPRRIAKDPDGFPVAPFAVAIDIGRNGNIWAVNLDRSLAHYDGEWTIVDGAKVGLDPEIELEDIALDSGGRVWTLSDDHIHVYEGGRFTSVVPKGKYHRPFLLGLALARDGTVLASGQGELFRFRSLVDYESHELEPPEEALSRQRIHELSDGSVIVERRSSLARVAQDGSVTYYHAGVDFEGSLVRASSADGQDRLWATTGAGITMIGPGKQRLFWPTGSIPSITGSVDAVLVIGSGPKILPPPMPAATGGLRGVVTYRGAPVRGEPVVICPDCEVDLDGELDLDADQLFKGTTNEAGHFHFQEVPLNSYNLYVEIDGKWKHAFRLRRWFLREGEVLDFGAVELE